MIFIGQKNIFERVKLLVEYAKEGNNFNVLFHAPSGYGKTYLAQIFCSLIGENYNLVIPDDGKIYPETFNQRLVILDEIQELKEPAFFYPYLDKKDRIYILCSNELGNLKEPLVNRCFQFYFTDYTQEEMDFLVYNLLKEFNLTQEVVKEISRNCNFNPRVATKICDELKISLKVKGNPKNSWEAKKYLKELGIEDGLTQLHKRYIDYLKGLEKSSLDQICFALHLDRYTVTREIEPELLRRKVLNISSKGRKLVA